MSEISIEKKKLRAQIVPWKNKKEWKKVYQNLFSHSIEDQLWALGRVAAWKSKAHPSIPLGVETTSSLISAQLCELQSQNNPCKGENIRLLYGMAIVRFINFVAELGQNNKHDLSIYVAVKSFNIPTWLVEMRHYATHSTMPSLLLLKSGVHFALTWLHENYWSRISFQDLCYVAHDLTCTQSRINELVKTLQILRYELVFGSHCSNAIKSSVKSIVVQLEKLCEENKELVLKILSRPRNFIFDGNTMRELLDLKSDSRLEEIPQKVVKFCLPMLKIIFSVQGVEDFLEILLNNVDVGLYTPFQEKLVYLWIVLITSTFVTYESVVKKYSSIFKLAQSYKVKLNRLRVIKILARMPDSYVTVLLPSVISDINGHLSNSIQSHLKKLFAIQNGFVELKFDDNSELAKPVKVYQGSDFENIVKDIHCVKNKCDQPVGDCVWEVAENCAWSKYSIGTVPESLRRHGDGDVEMEAKCIELSDYQDNFEAEGEFLHHAQEEEHLPLKELINNIDIY